jgi:uncharacterized protein
MECPVCGDRLRGVEKYGVEIEICPGCKGVWLDRGELETIIETTSGRVKTGHEDEDYGDQRSQPKKTTKQGLLGGLMDAIGGGGGD